MFDIILFDSARNENIVQINLTKVIEIFKKNVIYVLLISNRIVC